MRLLLALALSVGSAAQAPPNGGKSKDFPPGFNGEARTPPLGWRSWNAYGAGITQQIIHEAIDAVVAKNRTVKGWAGKVSLCDLGYCSVGIDEGWEGCGMGAVVDGRKTQHYANGTPAINAKFPDIPGLVKYGHEQGLKMGWYQNGCACGEHVALDINYEGDIRSLHAMDFDAVKLDGCGAQRNMTLYAELMVKSGKNYSIENCHWGRCTDSDDSSCPTREWCPFNWYRSSGDINAGSESWYKNLQTTIRFQSWDEPVSQPGCWAYPDMLEVGRVAGSLEWNRAHFGAWCIVSAPLVLGLELSDAKLEPILDIIGNKHALAVNQAWAGHPGTLVRTLPPPPAPSPGPTTEGTYAVGVKCDADDAMQKGWTVSGGTIKHGGHCLDAKDPHELRLAPCSGAKSQVFTPSGDKFKSGNGCLDIFGSATCQPVVDRRVDIYACNSGANQEFTLDSSSGVLKSKCGECLAVRETPPGGQGSIASQIWAKPLADGAVATLFINGGTTNRSATIHLSELNMTAKAATVSDVWNEGSTLGKTTNGEFQTPVVGPTDSAFLIFTPAS